MRENSFKMARAQFKEERDRDIKISKDNIY